MSEPQLSPSRNDISPKLGIIILNWNNWIDTIRCVDSLLKCSYSNTEIWVVDNGSEDESIARLNEIDNIHLIPLHINCGFAAGNNVGINVALEQGCDYILLLNNDTDFPMDFIQPLLEPFQVDSSAAVSCPKILYDNPANTIWYAGGKFRQPRIIGEMVGMGELDQKQYDLMEKTDFAVGTCMMIKSDIFSQIGSLDERFFFYHEDVDFCYRARRAGFTTWYQPKSVIIHKVSSSTENQPGKRLYLFQKARVTFLFKYVHGLRVPIVIFMEIIRLLRVIFDGMMHLKLRYPQSYIEGSISGLRDSLRYFKEQKSL